MKQIYESFILTVLVGGQCSFASTMTMTGGGKFVFVADGKVYSIANQNFAALTRYPGETINVTGDVNGDSATVSKIAGPHWQRPGP